MPPVGEFRSEAVAAANWARLSVAEYANFERAHGAKIVQVGEIYWRQVRPFFFRPLLPYRTYRPGAVRQPGWAALGGYQHAVPAGETANSRLKLRMFDKPQEYVPASLDRKRRHLLEFAATEFTVRLITDVTEFKAQALPVFQSFYERTHYWYKAERRYPAGFDRWADTLFQTPKLIVLGGYRNGVLGGVSVSLLVEDTLVYLVSFCSSTGLRMHLADLLLHSLRTAAAGSPGVARVFAGMESRERGLDEFFERRGARLVALPATCRLNPIAGAILQRFLPQQYVRLTGQVLATAQRG